MSYSFSKRSRKNLDTCDPRLREIAEEAIKLYDFAVIEGHRSETRQRKLFESKKTKLEPPDSKHNKHPSQAFDFLPCPSEWDDTKPFIHLAGIFMGLALSKGFKIRWGGNWDQDNVIIDDQKFDDLAHIEIVE